MNKIWLPLTISVILLTGSPVANAWTWHHLLDSIKHVESGGNPHAVSSKGARGAYQFMPDTARKLHINPWNPKEAREGARRYMKSLIGEFGSLEAALAAWNWGPLYVQHEIDRHGYFNINHAPRETQNFVKNVMHGMHKKEEKQVMNTTPDRTPLKASEVKPEIRMPEASPTPFLVAAPAPKVIVKDTGAPVVDENSPPTPVKVIDLNAPSKPPVAKQELIQPAPSESQPVPEETPEVPTHHHYRYHHKHRVWHLVHGHWYWHYVK